jgi:hypothetical protein
MAGERGLEPPTYGFGDRYSTIEPLSYTLIVYINEQNKSSYLLNKLIFLLYYYIINLVVIK